VCGLTTTGFVDTHLIPLAQDRGIGNATGEQRDGQARERARVGEQQLLTFALLFGLAANVTGILASWTSRSLRRPAARTTRRA
jgi:hypothetical protein